MGEIRKFGKSWWNPRIAESPEPSCNSTDPVICSGKEKPPRRLQRLEAWQRERQFPMRTKSTTSATRVCPSCDNEYPREDYGHNKLCRDCHRNKQLQRDYGISFDDWKLMLFSQGYECAVCKACATTTRLVTDGDKEQKVVYGIVCLRCLACVRAEREYAKQSDMLLRHDVLRYIEKASEKETPQLARS
jgi:hypothetical protein